MTSLEKLSATYRKSLATQQADALDCGTEGRRISSFTEMEMLLQRVRNADPILYAQVKHEIGVSLETAAHAANDSLDIRELAGRRASGWLPLLWSRKAGLYQAWLYQIWSRPTWLTSIGPPPAWMPAEKSGTIRFRPARLVSSNVDAIN